SLKDALIVVLAAAVLILGIAMLIVVFGPIILQTEYPYIHTEAVISEIVPPKVPGKTRVLSQRKLYHIDHWGIAKNDADCNPENKERPVGACDETHIFESWTVIGDISLVNRGRITAGTYGNMEALTPHVISTVNTHDEKKPQWEIRPMDSHTE